MGYACLVRGNCFDNGIAGLFLSIAMCMFSEASTALLTYSDANTPCSCRDCQPSRGGEKPAGGEASGTRR